MSIRISRRQLLALVPAYPLARIALAQQAPTYKTGVNVVNVFATVRDKDGHIVSNLTKDDFILQEDGRPQVIRYFTRETDLPLTLGLLVDTSRSQRTVLEAERSASYAFLDTVLREDKDKAFVLHFDHEVELLQDLTASREKLDKALRELEVDRSEPQRGGGGRGGGGGYPGGGGGGYPGGGGGYPGGGGGQRGGGEWRRRAGTTLYDAIYLASGPDLMQKLKGRKAAIVISDGVDRGSKVSIAEAIEAAQRSNTLVYSIYFASNENYGGFPGGFGGPGWGRRGGMGRGGGRYPREERPDGKKILRRISTETGGGFFEVTKKQPVDKIFESIQEELRNQYSIGYTSDQPASQMGYRTISLVTKEKKLTVQAREGYYPAAVSATN